MSLDQHDLESWDEDELNLLHPLLGVPECVFAPAKKIQHLIDRRVPRTPETHGHC